MAPEQMSELLTLAAEEGARRALEKIEHKKEWLGIDEAAKLINRSASTVRNLNYAGIVRAHGHRGQKKYYHRADLEGYMAGHRKVKDEAV